MSEGVLGHISKGIIHQKVDALVNEKNTAGQFHKRGAFLAAVKTAATPQAYLTILRNQAGVTQLESIYLRDTWYEEGVEGFWPWLQPIYDILHRGLVKALEEAGQNLPLDSYWVPAGDQVEVVVARSAQQVTRIILTPPSPPPTMNRPTKVPLWVVRRGSAQDAVGRETFGEIVETVDGTVITAQVKEM
jgi:hypothetical protein